MPSGNQAGARWHVRLAHTPLAVSLPSQLPPHPTQAKVRARMQLLQAGGTAAAAAAVSEASHGAALLQGGGSSSSTTHGDEQRSEATEVSVSTDVSLTS